MTARTAGLGVTLLRLAAAIATSVGFVASARETKFGAQAPAWAGVSGGGLRLAEPKRLRHRLLHTAARLVRSGRRTKLRLARDWPWAEALVAAFRRVRTLPRAAPL